jgi:hypothetical protein
MNRTIPRDNDSNDIHARSRRYELPAQPVAAFSLISSIDNDVRPSCFSTPNASETYPVGRTTRSLTSPPGSFSARRMSPGRTPRCLSISSGNMTRPFAATVAVLMRRLLPTPVRKNPRRAKRRHDMRRALPILLSIAIAAGAAAPAQAVTREQARRAAIHPVSNRPAMQAWLSRVPLTQDFPADFEATLRGEAPAFVIEMTTNPQCLPCGDLWSKLGDLGRRYGWQVRTINVQDAMLRSGRLGLPWVGNPVAWVRPIDDANKAIPIAIGTDHKVNLARNIYLAFKMLTGVRVEVGVRAMAKFTGIVGTIPSSRSTALGN